MKNILKITGSIIGVLLWFTVGFAIMGYAIGFILIVTSPILLSLYIVYKFKEMGKL